MIDLSKGNSVLYVLYYTAVNDINNEDSLVFQYLDQPKEEGIPIGKLFFWIKGVWGSREDRVKVKATATDLYERLMGLSSMSSPTGEVIGPFQNVEELRRFSYLLCQDLSCHQVKLFSVDELNDAIKVSTSKQGIINVLDKKADSLENLDLSKSKNFFNKILSRD